MPAAVGLSHNFVALAARELRHVLLEYLYALGGLSKQKGLREMPIVVMPNLQIKRPEIFLHGLGFRFVHFLINNILPLVDMYV